jgi:hypothetical protein
MFLAKKIGDKIGTARLGPRVLGYKLILNPPLTTKPSTGA